MSDSWIVATLYWLILISVCLAIGFTCGRKVATFWKSLLSAAIAPVISLYIFLLLDPGSEAAMWRNIALLFGSAVVIPLSLLGWWVGRVARSRDR
jgi:heme/copper-type cytochrome/quinol oxidase subunit 4